VYLHNPVFLPHDIERLAIRIKNRDLDETQKTEDRPKFAGRIILLHEVIDAGLTALLDDIKHA